MVLKLEASIEKSQPPEMEAQPLGPDVFEEDRAKELGLCFEWSELLVVYVFKSFFCPFF